jgi:PAS domain S-box-containing protein
MESIELLRANSNGKLFAGNVLRLRACIRKSLPPSLLNLEQVKLYQDLVAGVSRDAHPENQRIFDFFTGILHNVRDLIFVLDANGNFLYINDAGLDSIRYTRDDLLDGLSIYDVVVSKYIDLVEERMSAPGAGKSSPFTIEVYAKDGGRIPMEIDTGVLMDQSGGSNAVVGIARDLRLERASRRLDRRCRRIDPGIQRAGCGHVRRSNAECLDWPQSERSRRESGFRRARGFKPRRRCTERFPCVHDVSYAIR